MASHSEFNAHTTAAEVAEAFGKEINGKNVVITGVSPSSIGSSTALAIASKDPGTLILASRTESKLSAVAAEISGKYPSVPVKAVILDLASLDSIRNAAEQVAALVPRVDVLINNAGVSLPTRQPVTTPGGTVVDTQFFINHLGPFLFTSLLLPKLVAACAESLKGAARVVNLSSHGHRLSPVRFSDYQFTLDPSDPSLPETERAPAVLPPKVTRTIDGYPGFLGYGQSKTANVLHATELARRLRRDGKNVMAFSVHPGSIETELSRSQDQEGREAIEGTAPRGTWKTLDQGASTTLVAAFDPGLADVDVGRTVAGYMTDCQLADELARGHAKDPDMAAMLWDESEKMLGITVQW